MGGTVARKSALSSSKYRLTVFMLRAPSAEPLSAASTALTWNAGARSTPDRLRLLQSALFG
jgi:hypothetical protein